jgi:23S rRNA pseudouridine1911/1915/1917 synthase
MLINDYAYSSRLLRRIVRDGNTLINSHEAYLTGVVKPGDLVRVVMPLEAIDVLPVPGDLDIIYEDSEILVANKDAGVVTHPTKSHGADTLANRIAYYYEQSGQSAKIRFVSRLDMDTSGLVAVAKNKYVHHYLQSHRVIDPMQKGYVAFVNGRMPESEGTIDLPIGLSDETGIKREVRADGKPSITHYRVIDDFEAGAQMLSLRLETGRTHQIRVHLAHCGCPIIGDPLYNTQNNQNFGMTRTALHAKKLTLSLPKAGDLSLSAPLKDDMAELYKTLSKGRKA